MKTITERTLRAIIRQEINEGLFDFLKREPKPEIIGASTALQKVGINVDTTDTLELIYTILDAASDYSYKGGMIRFKDPQGAQEYFNKVEYLIDNLENLLRSLSEKEFAKLYNEAHKKYDFQKSNFIMQNMNAFYSGDEYFDPRNSSRTIWKNDLEVIKV